MPKSDVKFKPKVEAALGAYSTKTDLRPANITVVATLILSNVTWHNHFQPDPLWSLMQTYQSSES
eukprot:5518790-Ditylum_brightwellii.AAC.1